jgi:hypothetical protein
MSIKPTYALDYLVKVIRFATVAELKKLSHNRLIPLLSMAYSPQIALRTDVVNTEHRKIASAIRIGNATEKNTEDKSTFKKTV